MVVNRCAIAAVLAIAVVAGCTQPQAPASSADRPLVYAVNYPLAWIVEELAGDAVDLRFPVPPGTDPAFWRPSDDQLAALQGAELVIANGAGYARWRQTAVLPASRVLVTAAAARERWIELPTSERHSHGPEGEHEHGGFAGHTWLDPELLLIQAQAAAGALRELLPARAEAIDAALARLRTRIAPLRERLRALPLRELVGSHPVYQYLAAAAGWRLDALHWEPDQMPSDAQWAALDELLQRNAGELMLWEDEPLPAIRERLVERGLRVAVVRPCGNRPPSGDLLRELHANLDRIAAALQPVADQPAMPE